MEKVTLTMNDADKGIGWALRYFGCVRLAMGSDIMAETAKRIGQDSIESSIANPFLPYIQNLPSRMSIEWVFHIIFKEEVYIARLF